jgi:guanyl-specific ribonuclease Sa
MAPTNAIPQKALDTLDTVKKTGAAPAGYQGGRTFLNDGRGGGQVLPATAPDGSPITYTEYDVNPYTRGVNRGAERVVVGSDGKAYYTNDHYTTFTEVK